MAAHLNDDDRQPPTPTPPLDNDDLDAIVDSNRHLAPDGKAYTQLGHAERLAEAHGKHIRFVPIWGRWLHYSDGRWHLDYRESTAGHYVTTGSRALLLDNIVAVLGDTDERKALLNAAKSLESANGVTAVLKMATTIPELVIDDHERIDGDPWLLNCTNGTLDLRTLEVRPHDPNDLLMAMTGAGYDADAAAPQFIEFVEWALPDSEVRSCVQEILGLALVGEQLEHLMPVNLGDGANGKSTLTTIVAKVLGTYSVTMNEKLLMLQRSEGHETIYASLFRKRFAHSGEIKAGSVLNEAKVKRLTGGDRILARRMREDEWEFDPSHIMWLHANHRPGIEGTDHGIWRRLLLIPYPNTINETDKDAQLAQRIADVEGDGVLAWMVAGLARYMNVGHLKIPEVIRAATDDYRAESDSVHAFIDDSGLCLGSLHVIDASDLSEIHDEWFREASVAGTVGAHYKQVTAWLRTHDCESKRTSTNRTWKGIGKY